MSVTPLLLLKQELDFIVNKEDFFEYLKGDKELNNDSLLQLKQITKKYPYFQTAQLLLLKNMKVNDDCDFNPNLNRFSVVCADRKKLFYYLNDDRFAQFFPKTDNDDFSDDDRTKLLLHSFLESLEENESNEDNKGFESYNLETDSIVSTDYIAYLELTNQQETDLGKVDDAKPMKHQQLVDSFLEKSQSDEVLFSPDKRQDNRTRESTQDIDTLLDDDTFLTETLAQVYIKQKKYEQALTIIKRLSLNFPKKSIYFADQIRFLEYLIFNDKNKK